jgi:type I restriction enzyme S subunit
MSSEWIQCRLGDVITLKRGYDLPKQSREHGYVPIVSSSGISDYHSVAMAKSPGVVTGRYGTIGNVYFLTEDYFPLNTTLYVTDFKGNDPRFISYHLRSIDFNSCSDKAAVPGVNRNHLHELETLIPPIAEQKAIAHILGTLDDKIELNRKTNETLEAMARRSSSRGL